MAISAMNQHQWSAFGVPHNPLATEKEWFGDTKKILLGTVMFEKSDNDWNYVILGRYKNGQHKCIDAGSCFKTQPEARDELVKKMTDLEKAGKTVYP
jgi:hypothetical protein